MVTGGADGRLVMWEDNTAAETEAAALATEEQLLKQQELDNALHKLDYAKAVKLALDLQQPHRLRTTLAQLIAHVRGHTQKTPTLAPKPSTRKHQPLHPLWNNLSQESSDPTWVC